MKIFGTTGKMDDSQSPYDRTVTRDLPIRSMLPFCVDVKLCSDTDTDDRMRRFYEITHESGTPFSTNSGDNRKEEEDSRPLPPGWNGDNASEGGENEKSGEESKDMKTNNNFIEWNRKIVHHKSSGRYQKLLNEHNEEMKNGLMSILKEVRNSRNNP
jgi:hypothetical protein